MMRLITYAVVRVTHWIIGPSTVESATLPRSVPSYKFVMIIVSNNFVLFKYLPDPTTDSNTDSCEGDWCPRCNRCQEEIVKLIEKCVNERCNSCDLHSTLVTEKDPQMCAIHMIYNCVRATCTRLSRLATSWLHLYSYTTIRYAPSSYSTAVLSHTVHCTQCTRVGTLTK